MNDRSDMREPSILRRRAALAFGGALRSARAERGVSQMNLAMSISLDPSFVSLLERGHRTPSFIVIVQLADGLKMSPVRLFAEGVARLPETAPTQAHAFYRLAHRRSDGLLLEMEGGSSDVATAVRSADLQNVARRKSGEPELTHLVEYFRTTTIELTGRRP